MEPMPRGPVPVSPQHTSTQAPGQVFIERRLQPGPGLCTASSPGNKGSAPPPSRAGSHSPSRVPHHPLRLLPPLHDLGTRRRRRPHPLPPSRGAGPGQRGPSAGPRARTPQGQPASSWGAWLKVRGRRAAASLIGAPAGPCPPTAAPPSPPPGTGSCRRPQAAGAVPPGAAGSLRRAAVSGQQAGRGPPPAPGHD